jgi:hypothetical protein
MAVKTSALTKRIASIQDAQHQRYLRWLTVQIAANLGITPAEVQREAEELVRHWKEIGATTNEAKLADVAVELELSTEDLLERLRADPLTGHAWHD